MPEKMRTELETETESLRSQELCDYAPAIDAEMICSRDSGFSGKVSLRSSLATTTATPLVEEREGPTMAWTGLGILVRSAPDSCLWLG
ncbi:hypothetical protein TIFTF001_045478 [Ficus carica]|uniref:Uncharacterized protein n=1 Tax=Ficus carica TaxID=3494 RepID=A0AA88CI50_FICCA|nr:hypothetical protein TIFTF001_045478 [Ficus carica]